MSFEEVFEEKQVIEKDVLEQLPSVRRLAELYKQDTLEDKALKINHVVSSKLQPRGNNYLSIFIETVC